MLYVKPQLLTDTFYLAKRSGKKIGQQAAPRPNNTKKNAPPKAPASKRVPLTPEAKKEKRQAQWRERYGKAKALGICRSCGDPAIEGQTRCEGCAERHRASRRVYDQRRRSTAKQTEENLTSKPLAQDSTKSATQQPARKVSGPGPALSSGRSNSANRREHEHLRRQHPERREAHRRIAQERRQKAKELGLCRDCRAEAISGQTRCETCAEKHRISRRTYDVKRRAAVN